MVPMDIPRKAPLFKVEKPLKYESVCCTVMEWEVKGKDPRRGGKPWGCYADDGGAVGDRGGQGI